MRICLSTYHLLYLALRLTPVFILFGHPITAAQSLNFHARGAHRLRVEVGHLLALFLDSFGNVVRLPLRDGLPQCIGTLLYIDDGGRVVGC